MILSAQSSASNSFSTDHPSSSYSLSPGDESPATSSLVTSSSSVEFIVDSTSSKPQTSSDQVSTVESVDQPTISSSTSSSSSSTLAISSESIAKGSTMGASFLFLIVGIVVLLIGVFLTFVALVVIRRRKRHPGETFTFIDREAHIWGLISCIYDFIFMQ